MQQNFRFGPNPALFLSILISLAGPACTKKGAASNSSSTPVGFSGYLSLSVNPPSTEYGYGFSFYSTAWPLLAQPIQGFQVGLPSTWLYPNNWSFNQPLCPSSTVAYSWSGRAENEYRDVFQTIEGGMGNWAGNQFPTSNPKYSINGTPNCYNNQIASPGWDFFTDTTSLPSGKTGIVQFSNRMIIPPDGITLGLTSNDGLLGISWMALNLTSSKTQSSVPVGNQSWTLFLNSANFSGPVAFWVPDTWTWLSQTDSTDQGRGLDALPGYLNSFAMEFNTVPYFQATDSGGNTYLKVPPFQFPVSSDGYTHLVQDVTYYSTSAFLTPVSNALASSTGYPTSFDLTGAMSPTCTPDTLSFSASSTLNAGSSASYDFSSVAQTVSFSGCSYGISWTNPETGYASFPQYFELPAGSSTYSPVSSSQVPVSLVQQTFTPNPASQNSYTSIGSTWSTPGPASSPIEVTLADGSKVTYAWYRFIDQPALQGLGWTSGELNALQSVVTALHGAWNSNLSFQPPPSTGSLVSLDTSLLVTPPSGMEAGYVPIVTQQSAQ
jgi:hypothetical protein